MGTKGREIVGVDIAELLQLLNKALADEWLAYYQYWVGSKVASGRMRGIIAGELKEHAEEELGHAEKLAERILQLGGTPLTHPDQWKKESNCGYDEPADPDTRKLVEQNIKGEQCAIAVYQKLLKRSRARTGRHGARGPGDSRGGSRGTRKTLEAILADLGTKIPHRPSGARGRAGTFRPGFFRWPGRKKAAGRWARRGEATTRIRRRAASARSAGW
jgi:bacterioferritin